MTRKQALQYAITVLNAQNIVNKGVILKIQDIMKEMPFCHWSKETIIDTLQQWAIENGRNPTCGDLKKCNNLPPHSIIKLRFNMTAKQFLDKYFPQPLEQELNSLYCEHPKEYWLNIFKSEYNRIKPSSSNNYNKLRNHQYPSWITTAKMYNLNKWSELLDLCNIHINKSKKQTKFIVNHISNIEKLKQKK
jgi:hypothetical protein